MLYSLVVLAALVLPNNELRVGAEYPAADTLHVGEETDADAHACLQGLIWEPASFVVRLEAAEVGRGEWCVRFPSPRPSGNKQNDLVAMEWYQALDDQRQPRVAPAIVVVHESGSGMTAGRLIARSMRAHGVHTFMLQLPSYGLRRGTGKRPRGEQILATLKQGIADVRRAKDAVAALPLVDAKRIALQGTSLGGFVVATTAGLDQAYDCVFVTLAGGDLQRVILKGERDAARVRDDLIAAGFDAAGISEIASHIEPLRLAHRLRADRTWMFSARFDRVVPPACSRALAKAAKLEPPHYVEMLANHYSGVIYVPAIAKQMCDILIAVPADAAAE